jgi:enediyne biosynthesis protein E4
VAFDLNKHTLRSVFLFAILTYTASMAGSGSAQTQLTDVSSQCGIDLIHTDGSSGKHYIVESVVCGLALLDYDNDGLIDIYFVNGAPLEGTVVTKRPTHVLYRNNGDFTFTDATVAAGVGDTGYGMGVVAGDYDQDGDWDLYLSNFGQNVFYRNNGDGTFSDATSDTMPMMADKLGAGCTFIDIDSDGDLDLYAASYVQFSYDKHITRMIGKHQFHPGPTDYPPSPDCLFLNRGDGTFVDISQRSGIAKLATSSMGVIAFDVDDDGDSDIVVANDQMPNSLLINDGRGNFSDEGVPSGLALDRTGKANGNMGIECADLDGDGLVDLFTTTYQDEMPVLYKNLGSGLFLDVTNVARIDGSLFPHVNWGCGLIDFDNDGDKDIFIACGHFMDNIQFIDDRTTVKVRNYLLDNDGKGKFTNITKEAGSGMAIVESSRGAAFDDLDNDGDIDCVVVNANGRPSIIRNDTSTRNRSVSIQLIGRDSNRMGIGGKVTVVTERRSQVGYVVAGRGYESHYGTKLHFGLGEQVLVQVQIRWPSGKTETFQVSPTTTHLQIIEGSAR